MLATIEAAVVVSYEYGSSFQATNGHQHKHLIDYLRLFFVAVNVILGNTEKEMLDMHLVITDVVVLTEYTEFFTQKNADDANLIDASTLDPLFNFMSSNGHLFSEADVVVYFSKYKFALPYEDKNGFRPVRGLAYGGAACTPFRGALIYDDTNMAGVSSAAHEILHLLGSEHDGAEALEYIPNSPGAISCPDDPKFVMSASQPPGLLSLSTCTRDQVMAFLRMDQAACLKQAAPPLLPPISEANLRKPIIYASEYCTYRHKDAAAV
ncbi:venom metalloproteinase antarease-like TpachMP_B [Dermacentor variabilis]|uniref:venom metalloproteinase antarease-like TpachMP_B n=1 Tax=Dermacentor variabilis TaxID=34621 RepID=UPI003F5B3519